MKKLFYIAFGLCAIMASCAKEIEQPLAENSGKSEQVTPRNSCIPACITAEYLEPAEEESAQANVAPSTKTSYPGGVFNWVLNDEVAVYYVDDATTPTKQGWYAYNATTLGSEGATAQFTIADGQGTKITAMDGWSCSGIAVYPSRAAQPGSGSSTKTLDANYENKVYVKVPQQVSGAASDIMLIGTTPDPSVPTSFKFRTAMAVLKVTVTGIPAQAKQLRLYTSDKSTYPLDGDFLLNKDSEGNYCITSSDYRTWTYGETPQHSANDYIYATISTDVEIASRDFYFNIPVGNYAKGAFSLKLVDANEDVLLEKTLNKEFEFNRNDLVNTPALANEWVTLVGTARFYDKGQNGSVWDYPDHAEIPIQRNCSNPNKYRLINPYGTYKSINSISNSYTSDSYLVFTVGDPSDDYVSFEDHNTGLVLDTSHEIIIRCPAEGKILPGNSLNIEHNKVIKKDGSGNPLIVQLAPLYKYSDANNGYTRYDKDKRVIIIFPDYDASAVYSSNSTASSSTMNFKVTGTNVSTAKFGLSSSSASAAYSSKVSANPATGADLASPGGGIYTGKYSRYISWTAWNSDEIEIFSKTTSVDIYCISNDDATTYAKQYSASGNYQSDSGDKTNTTITLAVSDNPFKGNIMITEFDGLHYIVSDNTHHISGNSSEHYDSSYFSSYQDGSPVYGFYNGTTTQPSATFMNLFEKPFYIDQNGASHYITGNSTQGYTSETISFAFGSNLNYTNYTQGLSIACWPRWIGNYYILGNNKGYDYEFAYFGGK